MIRSAWAALVRAYRADVEHYRTGRRLRREAKALAEAARILRAKRVEKEAARKAETTARLEAEVVAMRGVGA